MCVNLQNEWVNFILFCKLWKEKFTQIETFLHDRWLRRSRQISSLIFVCLLVYSFACCSVYWQFVCLLLTCIAWGTNSFLEPCRCVFFFVFFCLPASLFMCLLRCRINLHSLSLVLSPMTSNLLKLLLFFLLQYISKGIITIFIHQNMPVEEK